MFEKAKKIERKVRKTSSWKHVRKTRKQYFGIPDPESIFRYDTPFMMEDQDPEIMLDFAS